MNRNEDIDYDVRCVLCGWTADRETALELNALSRCPDCNSPGVTLDKNKHPDAFASSSASGSSDEQAPLDSFTEQSTNTTPTNQ
jgi:NAD-dependent SIR2 family protein deacetylase